MRKCADAIGSNARLVCEIHGDVSAAQADETLRVAQLVAALRADVLLLCRS